MADSDRFNQRGSKRGGQDAGSGRAGAYSGQDASRGGQVAGRREFGGYGGGAESGAAGRVGAPGGPASPAGGGVARGGMSGGPGMGAGSGRGMDPDRGGQPGYGTDAGATAFGAPGAGGMGASSGYTMRNRGPKGWQRSDERIHDDVCERLANEHGIDPSEVSVEVQGGTVMLTGTVPDRTMKYRIEDIVDGCSGVREVENRLRVSRGGGLGGMLGTGTLGTTSDARGTARTQDDARAEQGTRGSLLGRLFGFASGAKLADIMTRDPRTVGPDETLDTVAQAMKTQDVGAIPVCTGRTLIGMVTDRDLVVRAAAAGKALAQTRVSEVMTTQVHTCFEDEDVESALDKMGDLQVRRIPVVDRRNQLVGIVSLGDFAQRDAGDVEDALQDISKPG